MLSSVVCVVFVTLSYCCLLLTFQELVYKKNLTDFLVQINLNLAKVVDETHLYNTPHVFVK